MRLFFILFISLFISGCMETPELSSSKEAVAQDQIKSNKTDADAAKREYLALQIQRNKEQ